MVSIFSDGGNRGRLPPKESGKIYARDLSVALMARLRSNEWNFAHRVAALLSTILAEPTLQASAMGHAEPELTEFRGARRLARTSHTGPSLAAPR